MTNQYLNDRLGLKHVTPTPQGEQELETLLAVILGDRESERKDASIVVKNDLRQKIRGHKKEIHPVTPLELAKSRMR